MSLRAAPPSLGPLHYALLGFLTLPPQPEAENGQVTSAWSLCLMTPRLILSQDLQEKILLVHLSVWGCTAAGVERPSRECAHAPCTRAVLSCICLKVKQSASCSKKTGSRLQKAESCMCLSCVLHTHDSSNSCLHEQLSIQVTHLNNRAL